MKIIATTAAVLLLLAGTAAADLMLLEDGRIVDGKKLTKTDEGVTIHFDNGEVFVPKALVREVVIEGKTDFVPKTAKEKEQFEKGLLPFRGRWLKPAARARAVQKLLEERREYVRQVKARKEWRNRHEESTKHFNFEATVPPHIFEKYRDMMEAYYESFAKTWKVGQPKNLGKLNVAFYGSLKNYLRTSGSPSNARGYFKFVEPLELHFYYDRLDPEYTREVLFHEANHYLQMLLDPRFVMPHFPSEALAEYYGAAKWDPKKKKLTVGLIQEGRLADVQLQVKKGEMMGLKKLVSTPRMYEHYTWGWTLAHFLMEDKKLGKKFRSWVTSLARGKSIKRVPQGNPGLTTVEPDVVWSSFKQFLSLKKDADVDTLEARWHQYVTADLAITSARGLDKAAMKAWDSGWQVRARRLFREAIEAGSTSPVTYYRAAQAVKAKGQKEKAIEYLRRAVELDPLVGDYYAGLALALAEGDEAVRMAKLALEIDPDDPWLEMRVYDLIHDR
ncbi:MAG: hypothetical protein ABFS86_12735 [Planctomycetota bacterium]